MIIQEILLEAERENIKRSVMAQHVEQFEILVKKLAADGTKVNLERLLPKLVELAEKDANETAERVINYARQVALEVRAEMEMSDGVETRVLM